MKKTLFLALALLMTMVFSGAALADSGKLDLKVGDSIFACNCGSDCPCNTMARKTGKCVCSKDMVLAKVTKLEDGKAYLQAEGWDQPRVFKTTAVYACDCGPQCDCNTISQNPGKCVCGKDLKKVN